MQINRWALKNKLSIKGTSEDCKTAISGCFIFMSTLGLPLSSIVDTMQNRGFVIDWNDFIKSALKEGWKPTSIMIRLDEMCTDCYPDQKEEFLYNAKLIMHDIIYNQNIMGYSPVDRAFAF